MSQYLLMFPESDQELFWLACGTIAGLIVGWLITRLGAGSELRFLRTEIAERDAELVPLRGRHEEMRVELATLKACQSRDAEHFAQRDAWLGQARDSLLHSFQALAGEVLQNNNAAFLREASARFENVLALSGKDLAERQEAVRQMVAPLEQALASYQQRLRESELKQAETIAALREQITVLAEDSEKLAAQTSQLRLILSSNQARGRWGEETLRRVVEAAGMSPHCDFVQQEPGEDGRPDLLVKLPHEKQIIVDAKVPDLAALEKIESTTGEPRAAALRQHAATVRETVKRLAGRDYPQQFIGALDHVILFLPAESLFSAALEADPELITWAASKRVLLATPSSFIGLLRAVALSWRHYDQDRNAKSIAEAGRELYKRIITMLGHMEDIRQGLDKAVRGFNQMARSYETRVRPQGERLLEYGVDPGRKDEPPQLEKLSLGLEDLSQRNLL